MNKAFITIPILFFILLYGAPAFSMTIDTILEHTDLSRQLISKVPHEDYADMRLVCKKWAARGRNGELMPHWQSIPQFMPDSVEKDYDNIIKRKQTFFSVHRQVILFDLINDDNAVQWIVNSGISTTGIKLTYRPLKNPCLLSAPMLAKHYNKPETARLLIEADKKYKDQHWKTVYDTITIPKEIEDCLYPSNPHDFSFIPYLSAIWLDKSKKFEKLYKEKKPTMLGQNTLIISCLVNNSVKCFKVLLKHKSTKAIINKDRPYFFMLAIETNSKKLPKKLINKKLFSINETIYYDPMTMLDYYQKNFKDNKQAQTLLISLGAKTWDVVRSAQIVAAYKRQINGY